MEESVTYQAILRKGKAEGIVEGKAEGALEGAITEAKKVLRLLGEEALPGWHVGSIGCKICRSLSCC